MKKVINKLGIGAVAFFFMSSVFAYHVAGPATWNVNVTNHYYHPATISNFFPTQYFPKGTPQPINSNAFGEFQYSYSPSGALTASPPSDIKPYVSYTIKDTNQNVQGGCTFTYYADSASGGITCKSEALPLIKTQTIRCNICQATYNSVDNSCNYRFTLAGQC